MGEWERVVHMISPKLIRVSQPRQIFPIFARTRKKNFSNQCIITGALCKILQIMRVAEGERASERNVLKRSVFPRDTKKLTCCFSVNKKFQSIFWNRNKRKAWFLFFEKSCFVNFFSRKTKNFVPFEGIYVKNILYLSKNYNQYLQNLTYNLL